MKFYLDCEFDGLFGKLISMALVSEYGDEWYEVLHTNGICSDWVKDNVVPVLYKDPIEYKKMQESLFLFLSNSLDRKNLFQSYIPIEIIADWPDDIIHFCKVLITGQGKMMNLQNITFHLRRDLNSESSKIPHNAFEDAKAIAKMDGVIYSDGS